MKQNAPQPLVQLLQHFEKTVQDISRDLLRMGNSKGQDLTLQTRRINAEIQQVLAQAQGNSEQVHLLQTLIHQSAIITSSLKLEQVLEDVLDTVIRLTGAERAYLMLKESDENLKIRVARNWDKASLSEQDALYSRNIVDLALTEKQPIVSMNAQSDYHNIQSIGDMNLRAVLCIPLQMQEKIVGVLYADDHSNRAIFSQDMIPILSAFATQAAIAIQNAQRFQQVEDELVASQKRLQELQILLEQEPIRNKVEHIVESDYFRHLQSIADSARSEFDS